MLQAQAQPVTTVLAVALAALFPALLKRDVGLSFAAVVEHRELWRCAVAQLAHVDLIHLAFNLSALWSIGIVERTQELGSLYYLKTTALLLLLSPLVRACSVALCDCNSQAGAATWGAYTKTLQHLVPSTHHRTHTIPQMILLLTYLLIHVAHKPEYAHTSAVGYSCVLFGWMALLSSPRHPGAQRVGL